MKTRLLLFLLVCGGAWLSSGLLADEPKTKVRIELPTETLTYRPGPGVEQAQTLCITCHSADYVTTQPRMPRKFWEANVKKMKEKFGATLPDDTAALVDYLTNTYGAK